MPVGSPHLVEVTMPTMAAKAPVRNRQEVNS